MTLFPLDVPRLFQCRRSGTTGYSSPTMSYLGGVCFPPTTNYLIFLWSLDAAASQLVSNPPCTPPTWLPVYTRQRPSNPSSLALFFPDLQGSSSSMGAFPSIRRPHSRALRFSATHLGALKLRCSPSFSIFGKFSCLHLSRHTRCALHSLLHSRSSASGWIAHYKRPHIQSRSSSMTGP
jgi:hypothetical protein